MIRVKDYHKTYRETVAVAGLSFEVPAGAILGLVGPNGAGKTTTMRALAGIIRPTRGTLSIAGHDVVADPLAAKRELAYIPDDPKLFDALTVWEHLEFIASAYRVADFAAKGRGPLATVRAGGETQHDGARAVARDAAESRDLLRLSARSQGHPLRRTADGAGPVRHSHAQGVDRRAGRRGAAIIVSSHLLALVEDLCTHLLILNKGQSLFYGSLDEARSQYADLQGEASLEEVFFRATEQPARIFDPV